MKIYFSIFPVLMLALNLSAEVTNNPAPLKIGAGEAGKHYNQDMIVTGKVAQVSIFSKIVLLNLEQPYPDSPFTLVIFPAATNQFGDIKALDGKNVEVSGVITNYHDRPEIVLDNTNQLKVTGPIKP
jgi:DNA/RNA endonuclease YhcR with UshA esterase domain